MRWYMGQRTSNIIGGLLGLTGFATAVVAGLAAGNPAGQVLIRALVSMLLCSLIGAILGGVAQHAVADHIKESVEARLKPQSVGVAGASSTTLTSGG